MQSRRATSFLMAVSLIALVQGGASAAGEPVEAAREAIELPVKSGPEPGLPAGAGSDHAGRELAAPTTPDIAPPDLPAAPVAFTATDPARPAAVAAPAPVDIAPPDLPAAGVVITQGDLLQQALAARLAEARTLHPRLNRKEREGIAAFYALGNYQAIWITQDGWTDRGRAVLARLKSAGEDGLDPADYPIPSLAGAKREPAAELAEAELKLSAAALAYARDARGARVEPSRLSSLITPDLELPAADAVLTALTTAEDAGGALAAYNPPHPGYRALKRKLAEVRANRPAETRLEGDILANMERWRWIPADMGRRHVWVNVPEYKLRLMQDGRPIHEARVIVGKPETPTPIFSDEMDHAIVNPSWYMPPSIFKNEFFSDPGYAASRGFEVIRGKNGAVSVRQPPGERNALGFVKFMFPNRHAVYLHDTPNRRLFGADKRAFSHGCVRLDQPFRFGEFVLGAEWNEARLKSLIGRGERTIRLPQKVPVHITYFTLSVDEKGELRRLADLYGVNNKVRVALGLPRDGTVVAEASPVRKVARPQVRRKPAVRPVETVRAAPTPWVDPYWWVR